MEGWPGIDRERRRELRSAARDVRRAGRAGRPLAGALRIAARARPDARARSDADRIEAQRRRLLGDERPLSGGRGGEAATVGQVTKRASSPPHQTWLLYVLARELGARRCLEMGTCVGISGAYLAAAMATSGGGVLRTLEGHRDRAAVASETFDELGFEDAQVVVGPFRRTLDDVLAEPPFDLVFVDGHHDGDATRSYVARIRAASGPGTLLVLDDIAWSDSMAAAWRDVVAGLGASTTVDLGRLGLVLLGAEDVGQR